jgi:hypothetical protein
MPTIDAHGITAVSPKGWDGEIYQREAERPGTRSGPLPAAVDIADTPMPILHLANFALPRERGDYGGGAVESMGSGGVFISLLEHTAEEAKMPLFLNHPIPWPLTGDSFNPNRLQRMIANHAGHQSFFTANGRAFCLYVVIGSFRLRNMLADVANEPLANLEIKPR